jgi:hypothetical protein
MNKLQNLVDNTLHSQAHWIVNKSMARFLESNDSAIILAELIFLKRQHPKVDMPFLQQDKLADRCNVSIHKLRTCLNNLRKHKLVDIVKRGMPAKNHFKINYDQIITIMSKNTVDHQSSGISTTSAQVTTQVIEEVDNKSSKKSTTSGLKSEPHIKELNTKELPIKELSTKEGITIEDNNILDIHNKDLSYILSAKEELLTPQQKGIKAAQLFQ